MTFQVPPSPPLPMRMYVATARGARKLLGASGGLRWIESKSDRVSWQWGRSLLAIHDLDDLVALDLPWWTMTSIRLLDEYLDSGPRKVFEWGSGASTVWLSRRAASVVSVEHDKRWGENVQRYLDDAPDATLLTRPPEPNHTVGTTRSQKSGWESYSFDDFVEAIDDNDDLYDVIVVDGRSREACLPRAARHLKPNGVILFDDAQRTRYRRAIEASGLESIITTGRKVCMPLPGTTTLIFTNSATAGVWRDRLSSHIP